MRAVLQQPHESDRRILRRIADIERRAVETHDAPAAIRCARGADSGNRGDHLAIQRRDRRVTEACPRLRDRRLGREIGGDRIAEPARAPSTRQRNTSCVETSAYSANAIT